MVDIEKLARKLQPVMPEQMKRWMRAREAADPELRSLIEKQIIAEARKRLGDYEDKILLSLPPVERCRGAIHLGTVMYDKERWPFGLSTSEMLQNVSIFGRSGAGKTNVGFHIMEQLAARKIPFLFMDWKRTARHMLPWLKGRINLYTPGRSLSPLAFNPFLAPPGLEPNVYVQHLVDVLSDAYTLGEGAKSLLQKALLACYKGADVAPTVAVVLDVLEKLPAMARARNWKISAVRALESLQSAIGENPNVDGQEALVRRFLHESTIVELNGIGQSTKKFLIPILLLWLYYVKLGLPSRENLELVVFVEEAHHVFYRQEHRAKESMMNMLLRQCREMGIAMIIVDQHPHLLSTVALGNTFTSICLNLKDTADLNRAAGLSLMDAEDKRYFSLLPVGYGIVKLQDRWRKPVLLRFPLVPVRKGAVSDGVLREYLHEKQAGSGGRAAPSQEIGQVPQVALWDHVLDEAGLRFLEDVVAHPDDGVRVRYARLGVSARRGTQLKERLVRAGWLRAAVVPVGNSRKVVLGLTNDTRQSLGLPPSGAPRESLAHEYWKRYYARKYAAEGYDVQIEAPRVGGRVDVLATKDGKPVGIEIETGASNVVANVKNCLTSGFDQVLVVATSEESVTHIELALVRASLIISGRVKITHCQRGVE